MLYLHVLIPFDYTQGLRVDDVMMSDPSLNLRTDPGLGWDTEAQSRGDGGGAKWQNDKVWQSDKSTRIHAALRDLVQMNDVLELFFFLSSPVLTAFSFLQDSKIR